MKKMVLVNVITIIVLVVIGVLGFWFWNNATSYVTTDNAKVDGDQIKISSPASGEIKSLDVKQGDKLDKGDKVAEVSAQGEGGQSKDMSIKCLKTVQSLKLTAWKVQWLKLVTQSLTHII